ncbi:rod shape-determining protein MreD [bacterium]|nr:rod shape-determining protein MreD [bacterium]
MVFFRAFVIIIVLFIVQSSLTPLIQVKGITPDFILIFMVFWCVQKHRYQCVILGFVGGLLQDFMEGGLLGVFALSKSVACYLFCSLPWSHYERNDLIFGLTLAIAALAHQFIYLVIGSRNAAAGFLVMFLRYGIPTLLYTVLCGMLVNRVFGVLKKMYGRGSQ